MIQMKFLMHIIAQCRTKKTNMHKQYKIVALIAFKLTPFFLAKIAL